ncbi:hypothetical protein [Aquaticitalea lipolytica]|uniref:hypothetical protein n=1 Tax=Aquaticitalea lipolytica TaxID=1247562 RepID=UPI0024BA0666|nr:hypothetical protein [Aquaticitalea lipolytica]
MNKTITIFAFFTLCFFNSNAQLKLNDFDDAQIYFNGIFDENSQIDDYGNVLIDMGSATAGRYLFRITDVNIKMEERKEEPGCADICPPRVLIHFTCRKSECISDPSFESEYNQSGVIIFEDTNRGKKAYAFLVALKEFMKNN